MESGAKWSTGRKRKRCGSQIRAREDEEGSLQGHEVGVCVPLARFSNAPRKATRNNECRSNDPQTPKRGVHSIPDAKVNCPSGRASFGVTFPTVRSKTPVKCPEYALGGGGGWAALELTGTTLVHTRFDLTVAKLTLSLAFRPRPGKPCHCNFATVKFRK